MGLTDTPTREETKALAEASKPKASVFTAKTDDSGRLSFTLPQTENQVDFIKIRF
jgi:hypothetical protein